MKTKLRSALLLVAAALLLTACRVVVETTIASDGSGELRSAVVFSAQEQAAFAQKPENTSKSICDSLRKDVPADATFAEETRGDETFCITTRTFSSLDKLRKLYTGMSQVTVNQLQFELGKFTLDVDVDLSNPDDAKGAAQEWQLTPPGTIGTNNADRVEGQTLIWAVAPGGKTHLHAESDAGLNPATLGSTGFLILVAILAVLLLAVALTALLLRRRG
jgi:hypothetical protein